MVLNTQSQDNEFQLNNFYRDSYRRTMKWLSLMVVICAILALILAWITYDQKKPSYYAAITTGQVVPIHPMSEPIVTAQFIESWSARTTGLIYNNLNFATVQQQLNQARDRFTPEGWIKLNDAMKGLVSQIVGSKLITSSVVSGPPVIVARMIIDGRYTWRVQMRLLVTFTSASASSQRQILVTMNVQRIPTLEASQGIAVTDFTAKTVLE